MSRSLLPGRLAPYQPQGFLIAGSRVESVVRPQLHPLNIGNIHGKRAAGKDNTGVKRSDQPITTIGQNVCPLLEEAERMNHK